MTADAIIAQAETSTPEVMQQLAAEGDDPLLAPSARGGALTVLTPREGGSGAPAPRWRPQTILLGEEPLRTALGGTLGGAIRIPYKYELWGSGWYERRLDDVLEEEPPTPRLTYPDGRRADPSDFSDYAKHLKLVFAQPILLTSYGIRATDSALMLRVAFFDRHTWRVLWVEAGTLADARRVLELVPRGVAVTSLDAAILVELVALLRKENQNLQEETVVYRLGALNNGWLVGRQWIGEGRGPATDELRYNSMRDAMSVTGTFETWRDFARPILDTYWIARVVVGAAFASVLIRPLQERAFIFHQWGQTRGGKTALALLGQAAWGDALSFKCTLNRTTISVGSIFRELDDFPVLLDETEHGEHTAAGAFGSLIYNIVSGGDRGRATREGDLMRPEYDAVHCIVRTTGERRVVGLGATDMGGQTSRCLEVKAEGVPEEVSRRIYDFIANGRSHGHAGRMFLQNLWSFAFGEDQARLRARYAEFRARVAERLTVTGNPVNQIAILAFGEYLMLRWIFDVDGDEAEATALDDAGRVGATLDTNRDLRDATPVRVAQFLLTHRADSPQRYADLSTPEGQRRAQVGAPGANEIVGYIAYEPDILAECCWYSPFALEKLLRAHFPGLSLESLWDSFSKSHVLYRPDATRIRQTRSKTPWVKRAPFYIVHLLQLEEIAGMDALTPTYDDETQRLLRALPPDPPVAV